MQYSRWNLQYSLSGTLNKYICQPGISIYSILYKRFSYFSLGEMSCVDKQFCPYNKNMRCFLLCIQSHVAKYCTATTTVFGRISALENWSIDKISFIVPYWRFYQNQSASVHLKFCKDPRNTMKKNCQQKVQTLFWNFPKISCVEKYHTNNFSA